MTHGDNFVIEPLVVAKIGRTPEPRSERPLAPKPTAAAAPVAESPIDGPKTILLHVQDDRSLSSRLEAALGLARYFSAHLTCVQVTPIEAYVAFEGFGGVFVMDDVMKALDVREDELRRRIETDLSNEGVSWDYRHSAGHVAPEIASQAALADLVITSREPHRGDGPTLAMLGELLHLTRTPILVPGSSIETLDPLAPALVAYDGSIESINAVRAAMPLLQAAPAVDLFQVEEAKPGSLPGTALLRYLSRHGVHAELVTEEAAKEDIPARIVAQAKARGAGYVVMGGYGHSRLGEYLFGGVTRALLAECPFPLVVAR